MAMKETEPDLHNVDYEDVLHLYRGWRKAEGSLKEKNKELNALKIRVKQLQESHIKFRGQIQALESVKELTVSLQTQLSTTQQENVSLVNENKELKSLNAQAEEMLRNRADQEAEQTKAFRDVQIEFAMLRGRYEELSISQRELEKMTADEQAMRMAAETRLTSSEGTIDSLREENRALRMKLDSTTQRMTQCDESLAQASEQLATLSKEVAGIADTRDSLATAQAEVGILKGDIARLMRLLEHYPSAKGFLQKWRDGESMSFMGIPGVGASSLEEETHGGSDLPRAFNEAEYQKEKLISPEEVDQLKRLHGIDTFPVQKTFQQESEYWVPREAAHIGMSFMVSKIPHAPPGMIYEFLRNLSKVWLKREKRKLGRIRDMYEKKLSDMRRRIENAKPYKGVMAGQQIKRLKSQVKEKTLQKLSGHPKPRPDTYDAEYEDYLTFEEPDTEIRKRGPHEMRISDQIRKAGEDAIVRRSVEDVSAEKLLEASLISLETIGRQRATDKKSENLALGSGYGEGPFPSESYLKGALWIGRNLTLVIEELADSLDIYRNKHLVEVAGAVQDSDPRRSSHRLNLLAAAGITECLSLANTSRMRARNILQGAASILPGDNHALKGFVSTLPIESAVGKATDQAREPLSPRQLRRSRAWEESPHHSSMTH